MNKRIALTTAFLLVTGTAYAQMGEFAEWDADANAGINAEEFGTGIGTAGAFDAWDENDDELIGEDEFNRRAFGLWDRDDDEQLTEAEFGEGWRRFGMEGEGDYAAFDRDAGGFVDENEFGEGWGEDNALYNAWNTDEAEGLGEEEFSAGTFGVWDENDDEAIGEEEFAGAGEEEGWFE